MRIDKLSDKTGGWFVGDFEKAALRSPAAEVAVKYYRHTTTEARHEHRIATELTLIVKGVAEMNGHVLGPGDIIVLEPGESADFHCMEDTMTVVVKIPSIPGDKYFV